mgnify:CR=1 FL=1
MKKIIAIVGPESTGKSTLSKSLSIAFGAGWVPEYARQYLEKLNRPYQKEDLLAIAKGQLIMEDEAYKKHDLVFCDTNLLVIKIWSEYKYGACDAWISKTIQERKYDLHLLTYIDLPWQDDPQREHPHAREELFRIYENELKKLNIEYSVVKGKNEERLKSALEEVKRRIVSK